MLLVKFTAADLRLIEYGKDHDNDHSVLTMVRERVREAEQEKKEIIQTYGYTFREAIKDLRSVLGDSLIIPPKPDKEWYARVGKAIREYQMDEAYVKALAHYVKSNLNPPYDMQFIITQHVRIKSGNFDAKKGPVVQSNWMKDVLPD